MRIGIDAREVRKGSYTGLRTIMDGFLSHDASLSRDEMVFFCDQHTDLDALPGYGKKSVIEGANTLLWDQFRLPSALKAEEIDVFFTPYIKTPLWRICPYVNTIADIIPLSVPKHGGLKGFLEKVYFYGYAFICGRRAVKVITISEDARLKMIKVLGIPKEKIRVVYPAVTLSFPDAGAKEADIKRKYELDDPYIIYIGNLKPHKNIGRLIEAFKLLPQETKRDYRLFLFGASPAEWARLAGKTRELGLESKVVPVPGMGHEEKTVFLDNASLFVFPSLCEGFGIPPVEAMAAGVPVAASGIAPMTEALGDAAVYFDPLDPVDMARTISRVLDDTAERDRLIKKGLDRAAAFRPEDMSRRILDVLEDAGAEKTLLISSEFPPVTGGMSTQLYNLWKRLPGKRTVILTSKCKSKGLYGGDRGLDIIRELYPLGGNLAARVFRTVAVIWHVWRQTGLRRIKCNHCAQVISAGLGGLLVKKLKGIPYSVYVYSADILEFSRNKLTRRVMRNVMDASERIIANSSFTKGVLLDKKLAEPEKVVVLTPGVDTARFSPEKGDGGIRKQYGITGEAKVVLTVSRLVPRKGHDAVIKAMQGIVEVVPSAVYMIVGDGPEKPRLKKLVKERGLEGRVIFVGEVPADDLVYFYNTCDLFILLPRLIPETGDAEGFGMVFLEAAACGKPVVAGRSGGVAEAVIDGKTGLLVAPEDMVEIKEAMTRMLTDLEYARELGANGLVRARKEFSWDARAEELGKYI